MTKNKHHRGQKALQGIEAKNHFLETEVLLQMAEQRLADFEKLYQNERLRRFRDLFLEWDHKCHQARRGNARATAKLEELTQGWMAYVTRYFGYETFELRLLNEADLGTQLPVYICPKGEHSVAVFYCTQGQPEPDAEEGHFKLTTREGKAQEEHDKKATLLEQVEKGLRLSGLTEALLFLPHAAYYLKAETPVQGCYLQCRWRDVLNGDSDEAMLLSTHLLSESFFKYTESVSEAADTNDVDENSQDSDEAAAEGTSAGNVKETPSSSLHVHNMAAARQITEDLYKQITLALEILINERLAVDPELKRKALRATQSQSLATQLFEQGLFVMYRLLFALYAEAKGYLPVNATHYQSFYSVEHLRDYAEGYLKKERYGRADPEGHYLWSSLCTLFTLLRRGTPLPGGKSVGAYNGQLFDPKQTPLFDESPVLRDAALARVLVALSRVGGEQSQRRLNYSNLGIEQIGAVYEALLAQKPMIVAEDSLWVKAHGGGVAVASTRLAEALKLETVSTEAVPQGLKASRKHKRQEGLSKHIDPQRPAFHLKLGSFVLAPLGSGKRQTASFYTHPHLAGFIVRQTLAPLLEKKSSQEILALRVCEPAVGSGGFLIAALRVMGQALLEARVREQDLDVRGLKPSEQDLQRAKRDILEHCLYGVDLNPLAVELCRMSLYLEGLVEGEPLPFLHHHLRHGNALWGADLRMRRHQRIDGHDIPLVLTLPLDVLKATDKLIASYVEAAAAHSHDLDADELKAQVNARLKELRQEHKALEGSEVLVWANRMQAQVREFLNHSSQSMADFEGAQKEHHDITWRSDRHMDYHQLLPDMDTVLVEAYGELQTPQLEKRRRQALLRELGPTLYQRMVKHQRAYLRLRALGDLWCALTAWPLTHMALYPSFAQYQALVSYLLDPSTLDPKKRAQPLRPKLRKILSQALRLAKAQSFFHWDLAFAPVFADARREGFHAVLSNPPWAVVGVKDKEVFPLFDPQFMDAKPSEKNKRKTKLYQHCPQAADAWLARAQHSERLSALWQEGWMAAMKTSGKNDLATLFVLRAEDLVQPQGRMGLLVSRSSVFVNGGTKALREHFYGAWGLEVGVSFINRHKLFEIGSNIEFSALIGQRGRRQEVPMFVHGVADVAELAHVAHSLKHPTQPRGQHAPVRISLETIQRTFARETLAIPGLTDPRQLEIAQALHAASGPVVYLNDIKAKVRVGIDQTAGPKKGDSAFAKDIPAHELPRWEDVRAGKLGKWIPLYRGQHFNLLDPYYGSAGDPSRPPEFNQYARREVLEAKGVDLTRPTVVWRAIARSTDQRTLIASLLPAGVWCDNRVFACQLNEIHQRNTLACYFASLCADMLIRLQVSSDISKGAMDSLPIPNYRSGALRMALQITQKDKISKEDRAKIDALIWIHYGLKQPALNRDNLAWMLSHEFPCLGREDPHYAPLVLEAYDTYTSPSDFPSFTVDLTPVFDVQTQEPDASPLPLRKAQG